MVADATWGMRLDPANKARWLGLRSNAQAAGGRFDAALADALAAVRLDPGRADAWLALAKVEESLSHPAQDWLADYERAARLEPAFAGLYQAALARARAQPPEGPRAGGRERGLPTGGRLAAAWAFAAGGLLLALGVVSLLHASRRGGEG